MVTSGLTRPEDQTAAQPEQRGADPPDGLAFGHHRNSPTVCEGQQKQGEV